MRVNTTNLSAWLRAMKKECKFLTDSSSGLEPSADVFV